MAKLAVIADDLTGANDTAVQFAKCGIRTCVKLGCNGETIQSEESDVIVIDTDSRDMKADAAYRVVKKACEAVKAQQVENIYKKVDSTLRGNLGAEIAAADDVFHPDAVVIAPAFPSNQRITIGGYHFLDGMPIELTEIAHAPKTPVKESQIKKLLQKQTKCRIASISLSVMKKGVEATQQAVEQCLLRNERWIVFDVADEDDFDIIFAAMQFCKNVLWVGSAGLANHLPKHYKWSEKKKTALPSLPGSVLIVAGSVSHITQRQIKEVMQKPGICFVKLTMPQVFTDRDAVIAYCREKINQHIAAGFDVLFVSAVSDEDVSETMRAGRECGMRAKEVSELTAGTLAEVVQGLHLKGISGLVLTGGDTAIHVCKAIGAKSIEILEEISNGVPLGCLIGGACQSMKVVTKAGAFGAKDVFSKAVEQIKKQK